MSKPLIDFDYAGYPIYLMMACAGLAAGVLRLGRVQDAIGCTPVFRRRITSSFLAAFAAGVFCANAANWLLFPKYLELPLAERVGGAGFSFYYGMLGFFSVSILVLKLRKVDSAYWINQVVPSVLIFHAVGRIGCSLEGCCYGREISMFGSVFLFPARELEACALFLLYHVFKTRIMENRLFWYLLSYAVLRFLIEFGRGDDRGRLLVSWLSPAQVTSLIILAALGAAALVRRAGRLKTPV